MFKTTATSITITLDSATLTWLLGTPNLKLFRRQQSAG